MHNLRALNVCFVLCLCSMAFAQTPVDEVIEAEKAALEHIQIVNNLLERQDKVPFDEIITSEFQTLFNLKPKIEDKYVQRQIDQTIEKYYAKKKELEKLAEEQAAASAAAAQAEAEAKEALAKEEQKEAERIAEEKRIATEKEAKKRRILYTILAVGLAILMFVGNQFIQHIRNMKTQKSIMQMQQGATGQVESKAKRRAEGEIRRQASRATGGIKQKGCDLARKKPGKNNRFSI